MAKYSFTTKEKKSRIQERKRAAHGDPNTGKLKQRKQPTSISGKRKRKLFKKWRRDQKDAIKQGHVTMEDVEMAVAEGTSQRPTEKSKPKFPLKRSSNLRIKKLKQKGKKKNRSEKARVTADATADLMVE